MKKQHGLVLILALSLCLSGCVSVNLGGGTPTKADDVKFDAPASPFQKANVKFVDEAWRNNNNGNSISYLSDCQSGSDPSLESLKTSALSDIQNVEIIKESEETFNGRAALRTHARGKIDGIISDMEFLIFKKNGCIYFLNYVGVKDKFSENRIVFDQFIQRFHAP